MLPARGVIRVFAEILVGLGFSESVSYIKSIPTHKKKIAVGKSGPNANFNLVFLGLGWPWVGEFDGFMIIFTCFPTHHNLINNRKHPNNISNTTFYLYLLSILLEIQGKQLLPKKFLGVYRFCPYVPHIINLATRKSQLRAGTTAPVLEIFSCGVFFCCFQLSRGGIFFT